MILLEDVKRIAEKATGWKRPDNPQALLRERIGVERLRQPHRAFVDDKRPFGSRMTASSQSSGRDGIYDYVHYHSRIHEVLGIAWGSGKVKFEGTKGRTFTLKAGDVAILPAVRAINA